MVKYINDDSEIWDCKPDLIKQYLICLIEGEITKGRKVETVIKNATTGGATMRGITLLCNRGFMEMGDEHLVLGSITRRREVDLFVNGYSKNRFFNEIKTINKIVDTYKKRLTKKALVLEAYDELLEILSDNSKKISIIECTRVWMCMYAIVYLREYGRPFMKKENGQMGHLIRLYGGDSSVRLIIHYVLSAKIPSIGELLLKKDIYSHNINVQHESGGQAQTEEKYNNDEEF